MIKRRKGEIIEKMDKKDLSDDKNIENAVNDFGCKKTLAFLDSLLMLHFKNPTELNELDIRSEVDTFMSAGQDTTSSTIQFALQLIGCHPEVQVKRRQFFSIQNY